MNRKWIHGILIGLAILSLAGCGKSVEEQVSIGIASAQTTFEETPVASNKTIANIDLYLPKGFTIEQGLDELNFTLTKEKDSYILFVNTNENQDSKLLYEILMSDTAHGVIQEQTFETNGAFGFSAVVKHSEEQYELVVSIGGVKMTTLSADKKIDAKLAEMMEIVRSVHISK
ncbi:hypothetical protein [Solibacillus sp. FSL H8-0538]|uniref:hypothetical protein n=1 Tax=Solibacillus sp. FSL H8-0538 TaxID=2921400 RepID=UPI0030F828D9